MSLILQGQHFQIIDTQEKMTVPDCFVLASNKIGSAHGEAKFYIGQNTESTWDFWGTKGFEIKCFLLKKDLLDYMDEVQVEYNNPQSNYRDKDKLSKLWLERYNKVLALNELIFFNIRHEDQIKGSRVYINSSDPIYTLIREISLPEITYLAASKVKNEQGENLFYFRLFVDYFGETEHIATITKELQNIQNTTETEEFKLQLTKARLGQGQYRKKLLDECPRCPVTLISDDRLLIASHIKPWSKSDKLEKIDPKNGFMFTPNIDHLFDKGYISFTEDKKMMASQWLSKMTYQRLSIKPNSKIEHLPIKGREQYLEYHRKNVFKG
ncbi:MAG: HNH endonuclease [Vampirovibrionales bacterium]